MACGACSVLPRQGAPAMAAISLRLALLLLALLLPSVGALEDDPFLCILHDGCKIDGTLSAPKEKGNVGLYATGVDMVMNCTLEDLIVNGTELPLDRLSSADIYFHFAGKPVPPEQVHVVGPHTAQLRRPNATRARSGAYVYCYLRGYFQELLTGELLSLQVAQKSILVADMPVAPNVTSCRVYNWKKMVCTWLPATQDTGMPTEQFLYYSVMSPPGACQSQRMCAHPENNTCVWKADKVLDYDTLLWKEKYCLSVVARNDRGSVWGVVSTHDSGEIVEPDAVKDLKVEASGSREIKVSWLSPVESGRSTEIRYKIQYSSQWGDEGEVNVTNFDTVTLVGLTPYTSYHITVSCIPLINGEEKGFWSQPRSESITTGQDVPGAAPAVSVGGFTMQDMGSGTRKVEILWQPIPPQLAHGKIRNYRVRVYHGVSNATCLNPKDDQQNLLNQYLAAGGAHTYSVTLDLEHDFTLLVDALGQGVNDDLCIQPIVVTRLDAMPEKPEAMAAIGNDSAIWWHWNSVAIATRYTAYWCHGSRHNLRCKNPLAWQVLDQAAAPEFTLSLEAGLTFEDYVVGVSVEATEANGTVRSSGILWADCIYDSRKAPGVPLALRQVTQAAQEDRALQVAWDRPKCPLSGYIDHFLVTYCRSDLCEDTDQRDEDRHNATGVIETPVLQATLTALESGATYIVRVKSVSATSESAFSESLELEVLNTDLTGPEIAGIAIGSVVVLVFVVVGVTSLIWRRKGYNLEIPLVVSELKLPASDGELVAVSDGYACVPQADSGAVDGDNR